MAEAEAAAAPAVATEEPVDPSWPVDPKLLKLRELFAKADGGQGISALIVPTEDPHMVSECQQQW